MGLQVLGDTSLTVGFRIAVLESEAPPVMHNPNMISGVEPHWDPQTLHSRMLNECSDAKLCVTKRDLVSEMQRIGNASWLARRNLEGQLELVLKRKSNKSTPQLLVKYKELCQSDIATAEFQRAIAKHCSQTTIEDCELDSTAHDSVLLLAVLVEALHGILPASDPCWINQKLKHKLLWQLNNLVSAISGAVPDWCYVLPQNYPSLFSFDARRSLFLREAFGIKEDVLRLQERLLSKDTQARDRLTAEVSKLMNAGEYDAAMRKSNQAEKLDDKIKERSVMQRGECIVTSSQRLEDGAAMLELAKRIMPQVANNAKRLHLHGFSGTNQSGAYGTGLTRAFYSSLASYLISEELNQGCPLWIGAEEGLSARGLAAEKAIPMMIAEDKLDTNILATFRVTGTLFAKAAQSGCVFPLPLDPAVFIALSHGEADSRIVVQMLAPLDQLDFKFGYEGQSAALKVGDQEVNDIVTRYDIIHGLLLVCDQVEAIHVLAAREEGSAAEDSSEVQAKLQQLGNRQTAGSGWLAVATRLDGTKNYCHESLSTTTEFLVWASRIIPSWELFDSNYAMKALPAVCILDGCKESSYLDYIDLTLNNVRAVTAAILETLETVLLPQIRALRDGIEDVFPVRALRMFFGQELEALFNGNKEVWWAAGEEEHEGWRPLLDRETAVLKLGHMQSKTGEQSSLSSEHPTIKALLAVLTDFNMADRRRFLLWSTATPRLTEDLQLEIHLHDKPLEQARATTCTNTMYLHQDGNDLEWDMPPFVAEFEPPDVVDAWYAAQSAHQQLQATGATSLEPSEAQGADADPMAEFVQAYVKYVLIYAYKSAHDMHR